MSLINHDGDSLECRNYVSDVFDANIGIWWHCDGDNTTQIIILQKGFNIREIHNEKKRKSDVRLNICIIHCLYQNKSYEKIKLYFSGINQHVQNKSYEEMY